MFFFCILERFSDYVEITRAEKLWTRMNLPAKDWKVIEAHFDNRISRRVLFLELISFAMHALFLEFRTALKVAISILSDETDEKSKNLDRKTFIYIINIMTQEDTYWTVISKASLLKSVQEVCRKHEGKVSILSPIFS